MSSLLGKKNDTFPNSEDCNQDFSNWQCSLDSFPLEIPYGTILLTVTLIWVQKGTSAQICEHLRHPTSKDLGIASCSIISDSLPLPKKRVVHNSFVVMQWLPHISSSTQWMLATLQCKYVHFVVFHEVLLFCFSFFNPSFTTHYEQMFMDARLLQHCSLFQPNILEPTVVLPLVKWNSCD